MPTPRRREPESQPARVRCLGPGREHTFTSPDRVRVRVCPRCRDTLAAIGGGAVFRCLVAAPESR